MEISVSASNTASPSTFTFLHLPSRSLPSLERRETRELLMKWGMLGRLRAQTFTFDEPFRAYEAKKFVEAFFQSPTVASSLQINSRDGSSSTLLGQRQDLQVAELEDVPCSLLTMSLFDRLEGPIFRENSGQLRKCFDDWMDDILISDELRQMLLVDDSESFLLYEEEERRELLFRLFSHLCIGGQVCQFEDNVKPYLELTRAIYKDLLSVQKEAGDGAPQLKIISKAFKVKVKDNLGWCFPENDHCNSFAYLIVDPLKRLVTSFYHSFGISSITV